VHKEKHVGLYIFKGTSAQMTNIQT